MDTKEKIVFNIKLHGKRRSSELVKTLKISRQTIASHLRVLVKNGTLQKSGSTHNAVYSMAKGQLLVSSLSLNLKLIKNIKDLEEDKVFEEVATRLNLNKKLSENTQSIAHYAFTEMLNNAIDHSQSKTVEIEVNLDGGIFSFNIRDHGIGIFENVKRKLHLPSQEDAISLLLKGKHTTMPSRHSGEGIFFTSRIADKFELRSHRTKLTRDNKEEDIFIKDSRFLKGTSVGFFVKKQTRKKLSDLFKKFQNEDFVFDRNHVTVSLNAQESFVARSQAKRLLLGLEKFSKLTFDFKGIKEVGQGFCDEIFRVFQNHHPKIQIDYVNAGPAVTFMVERSKK